MNRPSLMASLGSIAALSLLGPTDALAQTIQKPYDTSYTVATLGAVPGVPIAYGGMHFEDGDPNVLLIAGGASAIYQSTVTRDAAGHISGLGTATLLSAAPSIDGGITYGPDGVLFYSRWPFNEVGQIVPGGVVTKKVTSLTPLGATGTTGSVQFVPDGFPGAGRMKTVSFSNGEWNDITFAPDGTGTFDLTAASRLGWNLTGGAEGIVYVPLGSPQFTAASVAVCEFNAGVIAVYEVDANGDPIAGTRKVLISAITKPEGAAIDPVTNDLVFSTSVGVNSKVLVVGGFAVPPVDTDGDTVIDSADNCPTTANIDQVDTDIDRLGDACDDDDDNDGYADAVDAFPLDPDEHADSDGDGIGDSADDCPADAADDADDDGLCADHDDCPAVSNPDQKDFDRDGIGDVCDPDWDGDGALDTVDLCDGFDDRIDADQDGFPDGPDIDLNACDVCVHDADNDADGDGKCADVDNCPADPNDTQADNDRDGWGDVCDDDDDNDGVPDAIDAFPLNPDEQVDTDGDGVGDHSDACPTDATNDGDGDGFCAGADVCPAVYDPDQDDFDQDGLGDLCDADWDGDGVLDEVDLCIGFDDAQDDDGDGIPDGPDVHGDPCDVCVHDIANDADADGLCADVDNCPVDDNPGQADADRDGAGDPCDDDDDNDGVPDVIDAFPLDPGESADTDLDGVGDQADLCRGSDAAGDTDLDGTCDDLDAFPDDARETADEDGDGVGDNADLFDQDPTEWGDADLDGVGDNSDLCTGSDTSGDTDLDLVCDDLDLCPTDPLDADADGDLLCDVVDLCVGQANVDSDGDQICDDLDLCHGNDATGDTDFDGYCDANDVCTVDPDPNQADSDSDGIGDACETDADNDGVDDDDDGCMNTFDPDQANTDLDDLGDACDADDDNDGVVDPVDNCPVLANSTQIDGDLDGLGDLCDGDDDADGVLDAVDLCPLTPLNVLFDASGCSGVQRVVLTCGGPNCTSLRGYLLHVACVLQSSNTSYRAGLLTRKETGALVKDAVLSCW